MYYRDEDLEFTTRDGEQEQAEILHRQEFAGQPAPEPVTPYLKRLDAEIKQIGKALNAPFVPGEPDANGDALGARLDHARAKREGYLARVAEEAREQAALRRAVRKALLAVEARVAVLRQADAAAVQILAWEQIGAELHASLSGTSAQEAHRPSPFEGVQHNYALHTAQKALELAQYLRRDITGGKVEEAAANRARIVLEPYREPYITFTVKGGGLEAADTFAIANYIAEAMYGYQALAKAYIAAYQATQK